jgi:hypothetical protein
LALCTRGNKLTYQTLIPLIYRPWATVSLHSHPHVSLYSLRLPLRPDLCASKNGSKEISQNAPQIHPNPPPTRHQKGSPRTSLKLSQADLQADSPNVAFVFESIEFFCICVIWYARQQIQTLGPGTRGNKLGLHSRPTPIIPHPPPARLARLGLARLSSARLGSARLGSAQLGPARLSSARLSPAWPGPARLPHFVAPQH